MELDTLIQIFSDESFHLDFIEEIERNIGLRFGLEIKLKSSLAEYRKSNPNSYIEEKQLFSQLISYSFGQLLVSRNISHEIKKECKSDIFIPPHPIEIKTRTIDASIDVMKEKRYATFSGATHGKVKCENYLLMNFLIDENKVLTNNNKDFIKGIGMFFVPDNTIKPQHWQGSHSKNNSFTSLRFPVGRYNRIIQCAGTAVKCRKYCSFIPKILER